jgi:hypothetical protein
MSIDYALFTPKKGPSSHSGFPALIAEILPALFLAPFNLIKIIKTISYYLFLKYQLVLFIVR